MGTNALASYIVLSCRVRFGGGPTCHEERIYRKAQVELPLALRALQDGNIAPVDLAQASIGPGMAVF